MYQYVREIGWKKKWQFFGSKFDHETPRPTCLKFYARNIDRSLSSLLLQ